MASGSASHDAANNSSPCGSYFQKPVHLQNWWLTKPETDDDRKTIGVAGFTCTSKWYRERCFTSAPILKVYDFFELETIDGICVILQGYINKERTLENGFSSEVFKHFIIGFPPFWEEFCTSCPKREFPAQCASRVNEDRVGSIEGNDNFYDSPHGKSLRHDSNTVGMGVQDCEDTIFSNKISTVKDASLLETPHEHIIKAGHEVLCDRSPLTSEFEDDPSLMTPPIGIDIHCMRYDDIRTDPSPKSSKMDAVDSSTVSQCLGVPSRRVTRYMAKMDGSNNHSAQGSLLHDMSNLNKAALVDPEKLGSSGIARKDTDDSLSNNKAANVVDCDGMTLLGVTQDPEIKLTSHVGTFGQREDKDAEVSDDSRIDTISNLETKPNRAECSDPMDPLSTASVDVECPVNGSNEDSNFAACIIDQNDDIVLTRTSMKDCQNKKKDTAGKVTCSVDVPDKGGAFSAAAAKQGLLSEKESMTRSKSKRKIEFGSSSCELPKRHRKTSPKSAKSTSRFGLRSSTRTSVRKGYKEKSGSAKKEKIGSVNILSPESYGGKKSRSGRVLLPALEFWRNQTVIYNVDREVAGVLEGTFVTQLSRAEGNKTFEKGRRACKP